MLSYLSDMPTPVQIAVHVIVFVLLTYFLMFWIHRLMSYEVRRQHNDVVGFIIAVVGVFYGLIIASVLVIAINRFDNGQRVVEDEANLTGDAVRDAKMLAPQLAAPVRQLAAQYLEDVLAKEWPAQKQGRRTTLGLASLTGLAQEIGRYEPQDRHEEAFYASLIQTLGKLYDVRRQRIFLAGEGIAGEVWAVTWAGAVLIIGFSLLFGIEDRRIHFLLASCLAVALALVFALILMFDTPFQGDMSISEEPYRLIREQVLAD